MNNMVSKDVVYSYQWGIYAKSICYPVHDESFS